MIVGMVKLTSVLVGAVSRRLTGGLPVITPSLTLQVGLVG